jgi:hypothetical protein
MEIKDEYVYVLYATGIQDGSSGFYPKHTMTGVFQVNFMTGGQIGGISGV